MKVKSFWFLVIIFWLSASPAVFADSSDVHKAVHKTAATHKFNDRSQPQKSGVAPREYYSMTAKTSKPGLNGTKANKGDSSINGTTIHRKH